MRHGRRTLAARCVAHAHERVEQAVLHLVGQRRAVVRDRELGAVGRRRQADTDPAVLGRERARVVDQLVERLRDELGRAVQAELRCVELQRDATRRREVAVRLGAAAHERAEVEVLAFRALDRALHAARLGHRAQDHRQPLGAVARALRVDARRFGECFVLQVVQRRTHDRQRRIELVRELARERAQVVGIRADLAEQAREAARKIAEVVARGEVRQREVQPAVRAQRALRGVAQATNPETQHARVTEQDQRRDQHRDEARRDQAEHRAVREHEQRARCLLEQQHAARLARARHGHGRGDHHGVRGRRRAHAARGNPGQRLPDHGRIEALSVGREVGGVLRGRREQEAIDPRLPAARRLDRRQREVARGTEHPAIVGHEAHARAVGHERGEHAVEADVAPHERHRVGATRGERARRAAVRGLVDDGDAEARRLERLRQAQLDEVAVARFLPFAGRRGQRTRDLQRAGSGVADDPLAQALRVAQHELDAIARRAERVARVGAHARRIAHGDECVERRAVVAQHDRERAVHAADRLERGPVVAGAVEQRRRRRLVHEQRARRRRDVGYGRDERARDRLRGADLRALLAFAQQRFHLRDQLPARPWQGERGEQDQDEGSLEAHCQSRV